MARIINKDDPEVIKFARHRGFNFISINEEGFRITKPVAAMIGLDVGKFIHFVNDEAWWAFFINNDPAGFNVKLDGSNCDYRIYSRPAVRIFMKSTGAKFGDRFLVTKSNAMHKGINPIYEIVTAMPLDVDFDLNNGRKKRAK